MADLLTAAAPEVLLIELPTEAAPWLPWLADETTRAPVALAGRHEGGGLAFYPFADFSPELAAIRWARGAGVEVVPFDLPLVAKGWADADHRVSETPTLAGTMRSALSGPSTDHLLDQL